MAPKVFCQYDNNDDADDDGDDGCGDKQICEFLIHNKHYQNNGGAAHHLLRVEHYESAHQETMEGFAERRKGPDIDLAAATAADDNGSVRKLWNMEFMSHETCSQTSPILTKSI
jgi:hypothetical protein